MPPLTHVAPMSQEAILFTSWSDRDEWMHELDMPNILLPLMDKSLLQRAIEQLVRLGCGHIRVVLGTQTGKIRDFLQSGERWGCRLSYHYLAPQGTFDSLMRSLDVNAIDQYWLADAAQFIEIPSSCGSRSLACNQYFWNLDSRRRWSGWGRFSGTWLLTRRIGLQYAVLEESIANDMSLQPYAIEKPLSVVTMADVLSATQRLLGTTGEQPVPGKGCNIHRSARIVSPVWIGERVKIGANAVIGPGAMIGAGSFIDAGTRITESAVMPNTYVGHRLDLHHCIAQGGQLANISLDTVVAIEDASLLVDLKGRPPSRKFDRHMAAALIIGLAPLQVALRIGKPKTDTRRWLKHFRNTFYPGLREVVAGKLCLVGPTTENPGRQDQQLIAGCPHLGKPRQGLLNDAMLSRDPECDPDSLLASDMLALVSQGECRATMRCLRCYLGRVFDDLRTCIHERQNPNIPATQ